jgi:hypothetical protein
MVLAATYQGDQAVYLAEQVVEQLRIKRIPAYVFDYADVERRKREAELNDQMQRMPGMPRRVRYTRVEEQCGVLIGGYSTMQKANEAAKVVKRLPAPKVTFSSGESASDRMVLLGDGIDKTTGLETSRKIDTVEVNPFVRCFVTRNPAYPPQKMNRREQVDPIWSTLNAGEPYSLLKNKGTTTWVVKVYMGASIIESTAGTETNVFNKSQHTSGKEGQALQASALQAHELAKLLRANKFDAYVLHTRTASIVTVGGFDSPESQEAQVLREKLARVRFNIQPAPGAMRFDDTAWKLIPEPQPMQVPRL